MPNLLRLTLLEVYGIREKDLTPWFPPTKKPAKSGDYNASEFQNEEPLRYFNVETQKWSSVFFASMPESSKDLARRTLESEKVQGNIQWRGLTTRAFNRLSHLNEQPLSEGNNG